VAFADSLQSRWRLFFSRLNEVECREDEGEPEVVLARVLEGRIADAVPTRLVLRPGSAGSGPSPEVGPPCPVCSRSVRTDRLLVACGACLRVSHEACLDPGAACPDAPYCR